MASFAHFFIMFLVISGTWVVEGERCDDTLYKTGCTLNDCGTQCANKHNLVSGLTSKCIRNGDGSYSCHCFYDCN
ncbi:hypothetical protein M5689_015399 [Euphorbia peplus]|nr:hypothetical protein M5689_015399 [Euphorbia peplus]